MISPRKREGESRSRAGFPPLYLWAVLLLTGLSGCATRSEILSFREDTGYIKASLDTLNLHLENLRMQVDGLQIRQDRLVEEMVTQSDLRQYKAYLGSRMDDYESQALMISAQINDLSQRLTGVAQRVDEMKYQVAPPGVDTTAQHEVVDAKPRELYDQAYLDLSKGNYELAKQGFEEYLRLYGDTELADNALYWLGEADYVLGNYQDALTKFRQAPSKYPKGNKVPAALFKVGLCQLALKQKDEAVQTFQTLIQKYPGTPEASQAEGRLKELQ